MPMGPGLLREQRQAGVSDRGVRERGRADWGWGLP